MSDDLVKECLAARDEPRPHRPPSETKRLSLTEAYAVQDRLREALVGRGERVAGWKAGFTNKAGQEAWQVSEPVCAFLLASGVLSSGAEIAAARFVKPGVEAEIAFVMRHDLAGPGVTAPRALQAVDGALPALELIDFRHSGKAVGTDAVADGVYAKAIVLGGALTPGAGIDLALEGLVYEQSGAVVATNTAAEVMGHPLNSLAWIANHLGARGLGLRAGDVVMTGSVSKILTAKAGDSVRATYTRLGSVSVRFA
ncbi:MAG TPA: fumarylacetoacetate hydrolase family protein [Patescibacteria group bacterium]|nr:fumarylacetoacetate hydrolase family protein [Patescibacteria group bacterium]